MPDDSTRLNKHLALQLGISRREADKLIDGGRVTLNGATASLGSRFRPGDKLVVDNKPVESAAAYKYLALNKPAGYVCSRRRQGNNPTIYELLPTSFRNLKPVGRLDKDSSGLILLTNNGDFAHQMTHPKFVKTKVYEVSLDHDLEPLHQQMISDLGINLPDGRSQLILTRHNDDSRQDWTVTMSEGRNRQIRRTFAALGYKVVRLHRTNFGPYALGDIKPGTYQTVDMH